MTFLTWQRRRLFVVDNYARLFLKTLYGQLIKGGYSRAFGLEFDPKEIWQRGMTDHRIRDAGDYDRQWDYIHQNPVKRGLVEQASEYRCSSAYPGFKLDEQTAAAKADVA